MTLEVMKEWLCSSAFNPYGKKWLSIVRQESAWDSKTLIVVDPDVLLANATQPLSAHPTGHQTYIRNDYRSNGGYDYSIGKSTVSVEWYGTMTPEMFTDVIRAKRPR